MSRARLLLLAVGLGLVAVALARWVMPPSVRVPPPAARPNPPATPVPATPTPLPTSVARPPTAWSAVGLDGAGVEGIVGVDGSFAPVPEGPSTVFWLRDEATGVTHIPAPGTVTQSLADGHLPLITSRWSTASASLSWTIFARSSGPDPLKLGPDDLALGIEQMTLDGGSRGGAWTLFVLVVPENATGDPVTLRRASVAGKTIAADGAVRLLATTSPDLTGTFDLPTGPARALVPVDGPPDRTSAAGRAAAYLGYRLRLGAGEQVHLTFLSPMRKLPVEDAARLTALDGPTSADAVARAWEERLGRVQVTVPDRRVGDAFEASLAYLLMARGRNTLFSGPTTERAVWVRDVAYTGYALTAAGYGDAVAPTLSLLLGSQLPSGRQPPIVEADGTIRTPLKTEWDAPGELQATVVTYAQLTHDTAFLRDAYPRLLLGAQYLRGQLQASRRAALQGTPLYGLLPAGESAEDLDRADWHHYWDDLWALAGFRATATAATELGNAADAGWLDAEASALEADVLASVRTAGGAQRLSYIPNGPEDTHSTAMSRSATPAVWPYLVLDPQSELVQHSFAAYYAWTVEPHGGAYQHYGGNDWPYAGLSLAHAFYRLGMVDQTWSMLRWALDHQSAPHLFAWCEAVDPQHFTRASGDCPHSWMAAEVVLLVRDVLLREDGSRLRIGPYPPDWLAPGATVGATDLPTRFGTASYTLHRAADGRTLDLTLRGASPPDGYVVSLPGPLTLATVIADGQELAPSGPAEATLPPGTRHATLVLR